MRLCPVGLQPDIITNPAIAAIVMSTPTAFSKDYEGVDYERFWVGPGRRYLDRLEQRIVRHTLRGGQSIVEIGAGFGRLGPCYLGKYRDVHMVEPASNLRNLAIETFGGAVKYHDASVYALPFADGSFDASLMVRVFHHLHNSAAALKELHRILRPGGTLVFSYSNLRNFGRIAKFVVGKVPNPFAATKEEYLPDLFGHSPVLVRGLLAEAGFALREQYATCILEHTINALPFLLPWINPPLFVERFLGALEVAPAIFVVAQKR
jgi:SAM-dependent methyltransferase